jgi:replicative DNA helicase
MADLRRLPTSPHSIEAEQSVIGSLLISETAWAAVSNRLGAADFYRADHRTIFAAIATLQAERKAVDAITVCDLLERQGTLSDVGGLAYVAMLAKETPTAANIETYAGTVRERSSLRRLKAIAEDIVKATTGPTTETAAELVASAQEQLQRLQSRARTGKGLIDARQLIGELTDDMDTRSAGQTGLLVSLPDFDALTCGLEAGDLIVMAARPGMGKTALMVSIASTVSQSTGVAVFSAEMPAHQLMRRCVALHAEIPQGLLRHAEKLTNDHWAKISAAAGAIGQQRLWIDDTGAPSLTHIRSECLSLKSRAPLGLVLIDYVQLVKGDGKNRYEELRDVAYGLKALAKELCTPIIVLAQLNRGVETREHKRPQISDLRDSGAIEEAADIVGLLYSEGYYDPSFSMPYVLECHISKNRNGERGYCLWNFEGAYSRITPLDIGAAAQYRQLLIKPKQRGSDNL